MAAENFTKALPRVLVYEGGKVDDPRDPGGRTNQGVTQRTFDAYLKARGRPSRGVYSMTSAERDEIYDRNFWDACRCDDLPAGIDFAIFDAAVNSGPIQAGKWLQRALGADYGGKIDGRIGDATVLAARKAADHDALAAGICARRLATLKQLKPWPVYGKGWSARVANVLKISQAWASGSVGPSPVAVEAFGGNEKADTTAIKEPSASVNTGALIAAAGTAGTTITSTVADLQPVQQSLGSYMPWVVGAFGVLGAIGVTLTVIAHRAKELGLRAQDGMEEVDAVDTSADGLFPEVAVSA